jgi:hypothetical protein
MWWRFSAAYQRFERIAASAPIQNSHNEEEPMTPTPQPESFAAEQDLVLSTLEHDQLVTAKNHPIPPRHLTRLELAILWALRLYVLFMMIVVGYQFWIAAR